MRAVVWEKIPWLVACATLSFYFIQRWSLNAWVYPSFDGIFPAAREIATAFDVLTCVVMIAIVLNGRRPALVINIVHCSAPFVLLLALVLFFVGVKGSAPALLAVGAVLCSGAGFWFFVSASASLLPFDLKKSLLAVAVAAIAQSLFGSIASLFSVDLACGYAWHAAMALACLALGWRAVGKVSCGVQERLWNKSDIFVNPRSFIPASHPLFVSVVLSGTLCGVGLTYGSDASAPVQTPLALIPLLIILGIALMCVKRSRALDALYLSAVVAFLAALTFFSPVLLTSIDLPLVSQLPNHLFNVGANCLLVLALLTASTVGRRNPADFFRIAVLYAGCICLGILIGATAGHLLNSLVPRHLEVVIWAFALMAVVFVCYNLILMRAFSFDDVVAKVERVRAPSIVAPSESFDERCQDVACAFGLTPRETEILQYYARGRSTTVVQEALVLSYNTVKTHVKNIYRKMDVHSQQELIDLVDGWKIS